MVDTYTILSRFYDLHERPNNIAKDLNVSPSYITKIVKKDERYLNEKAYRQELSEEKRKNSKRNWIRNKRKTESDKQTNEMLKKQHIQASKELSYKGNISDLTFVKYNRSAYTYDKNSSDLVLNKKIKCTADVPKRVKNVIHPSFVKAKKIYM